MKMETKNEKKIAVEQLKAMMAKVMPMLTAGEKIDLGMVFILSARENVYETKQAEMENGSTRLLHWKRKTTKDVQSGCSIRRGSGSRCLGCCNTLGL